MTSIARRITVEKVKVCVLAGGMPPSRSYIGDSGGESIGFDCYSRIWAALSPGDQVIIPLGFSIQLDPGYAALFWDKSGWGNKEVKVFGGVIDPNYRDELRVMLHNFSRTIIEITPGLCVTQFLIQRCYTPTIELVDSLDDSNRGVGAFGSTDLIFDQLMATLDEDSRSRLLVLKKQRDRRSISEADWIAARDGFAQAAAAATPVATGALIDSVRCKKCGKSISENRAKYCGDGSDKDNEHQWGKVS